MKEISKKNREDILIALGHGKSVNKTCKELGLDRHCVATWLYFYRNFKKCTTGCVDEQVIEFFNRILHEERDVEKFLKMIEINEETYKTIGYKDSNNEQILVKERLDKIEERVELLQQQIEIILQSLKSKIFR